MNGFGKLFGGMGDAMTGLMRGSDVKRNEKKRLRAINSLDWEPAYASEYAPTFQKAESPVARSFLESFLSGANPAAIRPGAPGANVAKVQAQAQQNEMYGTPAARAARQRQIEQETPWAVKAPERAVHKSDEDIRLAKYGSKAGVQAAYKKYGPEKAMAMAVANERRKR